MDFELRRIEMKGCDTMEEGKIRGDEHTKTCVQRSHFWRLGMVCICCTCCVSVCEDIGTFK